MSNSSAVLAKCGYVVELRLSRSRALHGSLCFAATVVRLWSLLGSRSPAMMHIIGNGATGSASPSLLFKNKG